MDGVGTGLFCEILSGVRMCRSVGMLSCVNLLVGYSICCLASGAYTHLSCAPMLAAGWNRFPLLGVIKWAWGLAGVVRLDGNLQF